jgi:hypothetical protein
MTFSTIVKMMWRAIDPLIRNRILRFSFETICAPQRDRKQKREMLSIAIGSEKMVGANEARCGRFAARLSARAPRVRRRSDQSPSW